MWCKWPLGGAAAAFKKNKELDQIVRMEHKIRSQMHIHVHVQMDFHVDVH